MATKQVRWKCESCGHGLLAPSKPRRDDVRRYCLPCSAETGRLVERVAPALEKKRAASKETSKAKQAAKRKRATAKARPAKEAEKRAEKRQAIFDREAEKIWALLTDWHRGRRRPPVEIRRTRQNWGASGYWDGWKAVVRVVPTSKGTTRDWKVLAHELCHAAVGHPCGQGSHGAEFYRALRHVAEARWKVRIEGWSQINGYTDSSRSWGYKVDGIIQRSLEKAGVVKFEFPPFVLSKEAE